jgi:hypothetical protein
MRKPRRSDFVVCIGNDGCAVSLERRKIYVSIPDRVAEKHGLLRVVDESGNDYLYPKTSFADLEQFHRA